MGGKPCIREMRVTVGMIVEAFAVPGARPQCSPRQLTVVVRLIVVLNWTAGLRGP